jgi:hypothetical protein
MSPADAIKDETRGLLLSKTAVSEIGKQLWQDDQAFKTPDLSESDVLERLFVAARPATESRKNSPEQRGRLQSLAPSSSAARFLWLFIAAALAESAESE